MGEWELLPHPLARRIVVNGQAVLDRHLTAQQWVDTVYLAGRDAESLNEPWLAFGKRRGGLVSADISVTGGRIVLDLAGDGYNALFLSALLIEPAGSSRAGLAAVEAARRERFAEDWPVVGPRPLPPPAKLLIGALDEDHAITPDWRPDAAEHPPVIIAPGTTGWVDVGVVAPADDAGASVLLSPPSLDGTALPTELRWGQWRYTRSNPSQSFLSVSADHLRGADDHVDLRAGVPRRLNVLVSVPAQARSGHYSGALSVGSGGTVGSVAFVIDVPPVNLPPADRPVGIYHEDPAFMAWFPELASDRAASMGCDLAFMRRLGMTGLAPPLSTPSPGATEAIVAELAQVRQAGFTFPVLAYAPVKRAIADGGLATLTQAIAETVSALHAQNLPTPIWSIADEPGNAGSAEQDLGAIRAALKNADPHAVVAAHLNNPADRSLLPLFDLVLVNTGYGVDTADLAAMRRAGVTPWLYNMPDPEAAAGFFLWRSGAGGYVQWHGRATTADPFDPTDGREADVQFLPVVSHGCQEVPDVDFRLLQMARGIGDLRWMVWLEHQADARPEARALLGTIRRRIPDTWRHAETLILDKSGLRRDLAALADKIRSVP